VAGICSTFEELEKNAPGGANFPHLMKEVEEQEALARQDSASVHSLSIAGFASCPSHQDALGVARRLQAAGLIANLEDRTFATRDEYREWLFSAEGRASFEHDQVAQQHATCPFVWASDGDRARTFVGGCDATMELASELTKADKQQEGAGQVLVLEGGELSAVQVRWSQNWRREWKEMHRMPREELRRATYVLGGLAVASAVPASWGMQFCVASLG
jgi:hypothetical protein